MTPDEKEDLAFRITLIVFVLIMACAIGFGCSQQRIYAEVPGCPGAKVEVPKGCYVQKVEGGVQVRCPDATSTYVCKGRD